MIDAMQHGEDPVLWDVLSRSSPNSHLPTIPDLAKELQAQNYQGNFFDMLKENLSSEAINEISNATKNQHLSSVWKMQRVGALTASTLRRAARY